MTDEPTADAPAARGAGTTGGARPAGSVATGTGPTHGDRADGVGPDARTIVLPLPTGAATAAGSTDGSSAAPRTEAVPGTPLSTRTDVADGTRDGGQADRTAADPAATGATTAAAAAGAPPVRRRRRWPVVVLSLALVAALGAGGYLFATARAYAERLEWTEAQARAIGTELAVTRGELDGARGEIAALQAQLTTAQERITALADEKAQIGDDREAQRQLLDYQARVSEAAGIVASALERCVQGQDQLIVYLEDAASYDPGQLAQFGADVEALCRSASEANEALQSELVDR